MDQNFCIQVIDKTIVREGNGKYTNRKADRGGPTRWGMTAKAAADVGYTGSMETCPREVAVKYYMLLWKRLRMDEILPLSLDLGEYLYDFGVTSGSRNAVEELQKLLNVLNNCGTLYEDMAEDGGMGPNTLNMLKAFAKARGEDGMRVFAFSYNALRVAFNVNIAVNHPEQEANEYGWLTRIANI